MSEVLDEIVQLLDGVVQRLSSSRRTFTEQEALQAVWDAGYEIPIHADPRFVEVHPGNGRIAGHWRLNSQTVANTRLLNDLLAGAWDGRNLDEKLAALDTESEGQQHSVYYPLDARLLLSTQGVMEPAEQERTTKLTRGTKNALDALGPRLLATWHETGGEPWTLRTITDLLAQLGWADATMKNAWLSVRTWLLGWSEVMRVGQDYWVPAEHCPHTARRTRLRVLPLRDAGSETASAVPAAPVKTYPHQAESIRRTALQEADDSDIELRGEIMTDEVRWTTRLRTVNILEGFLHVPSTAHSIYPPLRPGEVQKTALRAMWHDDGTHFWLWLDRSKHHVYGPALADRLMWLEAGTILRVQWASDAIVIQNIGLDEAIRDEEARLIDLEALSILRGGSGENYRRSLQTILAEHPEGLAFAEVVIALRERQQHDVHRGTIHALLHSGGFIQKDHRWYAAPDASAGARQLRSTFVETLVVADQNPVTEAVSEGEHMRTRVRAIHKRLGEIVVKLRET